MDPAIKGNTSKPSGDDWRALLPCTVQDGATAVCKKCKGRIATKRDTARKKRERGAELSEVEQRIGKSNQRGGKSVGWGTAPTTVKCVQHHCSGAVV